MKLKVRNVNISFEYICSILRELFKNFLGTIDTIKKILKILLVGYPINFFCHCMDQVRFSKYLKQ